MSDCRCITSTIEVRHKNAYCHGHQEAHAIISKMIRADILFEKYMIIYTKEVAYKTLVRPQLDYAAPIRHPYNETETKRWRKCKDSSQVDLQAMAEQVCWTNSNGGPQGEVLNFLLQDTLRYSVF